MPGFVVTIGLWNSVPARTVHRETIANPSPEPVAIPVVPLPAQGVVVWRGVYVPAGSPFPRRWGVVTPLEYASVQTIKLVALCALA